MQEVREVVSVSRVRAAAAPVSLEGAQGRHPGQEHAPRPDLPPIHRDPDPGIIHQSTHHPQPAYNPNLPETDRRPVLQHRHITRTYFSPPL